MNDRKPPTLSGALHEDSVAMRCVLAHVVPKFYTHPKIVVVLGQMTVFDADRHISHS